MKTTCASLFFRVDIQLFDKKQQYSGSDRHPYFTL